MILASGLLARRSRPAYPLTSRYTLAGFGLLPGDQEERLRVKAREETPPIFVPVNKDQDPIIILLNKMWVLGY